MYATFEVAAAGAGTMEAPPFRGKEDIHVQCFVPSWRSRRPGPPADPFLRRAGGRGARRRGSGCGGVGGGVGVGRAPVGGGWGWGGGAGTERGARGRRGGGGWWGGGGGWGGGWRACGRGMEIEGWRLIRTEGRQVSGGRGSTRMGWMTRGSAGPGLTRTARDGLRRGRSAPPPLFRRSTIR